jgi:hypothetical protein
MKKFLLSCSLALGIGANAQVLVHESFESGGTAYTGFTTTGLSNFTLTGSTCEATVGTQALGRALSSTVTSAVLDYNSGTVTSNGKKIDVSVNYQQWGTTVGGNIKLEYAVGASTTFAAVPGSATVTFSTQQNCMVISGTIPEGTVPAGTAVKVRVTTTRTAGSFTSLYDAINIVQEVTSVPACTTFSAPANSATGVSVRPTFTWAAATGAEYYKLQIGTTAGSSNVLNLQATGTSFTPTSSNVLPANTLLYATVTPTNALGDATGCSSDISFTTGANPFAPYCGPIASSAPTATYPISSVAFAGVTNTSAATVGSPAHESFTSTIFELSPNSSNSITITGVGLGTNRFATVVFIDWNNNGSFEDAGEKYFTTTPFLYGFTTTNALTGSIAVPATAVLDTNLRMRVKYNYVGTANPTSLPGFMTNPCTDLGNGQAEDYTVIVKAPTTPPACTTFTSPANGSTTFASNGTLTWSPSSGATGYKLYIGTTAGGTDVLNGTVVTSTSYQVSLTPFTTYYAKVVAYNTIGDATGCTEISFTTASVEYCTPATFTTVEPITNVTFAGINNTTAATVGGTPSYQNFATIKGTVEQSRSYPISVNGNSDGVTFSNFYVVFVDWNQNGTLNDAGEVYFADGSLTLTGSTGTGTPATGNITVPPGAKLGDTRMRVKKAYYSTATAAAASASFGNPCTTDSTFGQVEDYTLTVNEFLAVSDVNKKSVSVYPNPFTDILNISDVKGVKSISVNDISGREVKTLAPAAELNLSNLKTGLYIVNLKMEDGSVKSFKAIKK